jgi:hypothetical protein
MVVMTGIYWVVYLVVLMAEQSAVRTVWLLVAWTASLSVERMAASSVVE